MPHRPVRRSHTEESGQEIVRRRQNPIAEGCVTHRLVAVTVEEEDMNGNGQGWLIIAGVMLMVVAIVAAVVRAGDSDSAAPGSPRLPSSAPLAPLARSSPPAAADLPSRVDFPVALPGASFPPHDPL